MNPVALISGASRGIGLATAVELARRGYRLALVARSSDDLGRAEKEAGASEPLSIAADVTDPRQVEQALLRTMERFGRLDALINVAGVAPRHSIEEMSVEDWRSVMDTNLSAVFYMTKFAWPHLKRTAQEHGPVSVVNISSMAARDPFAGFAAYGAAKAGLNVFDLVAAREGEPQGIYVYTIAPGAVETAMFRKLMSPEQYPQEKTLAPDEVARVIASCIAGELRHAHGEVIYLHKTL